MGNSFRVLLWLLLIFLFSDKNAQGITEESARFTAKIEQLFGNEPESELVFVLDSSGSVDQDDFYIAVEFVRLATSHISISSSKTRVSVISFSDCDDIHTRIDYIGSPTGKNKCTFHDDLSTVIYHDGGTCTDGALEVANNVFNINGPRILRVLMLLTDGESTEEDPIPVAKRLKDAGVIIFSIGIGDIKEEELRAVASDENEYVFILKDFGVIKDLAVEVKKDVKDFNKYHEIVSENHCNDLCDDRAVCACATRSGSYLCACEAGFTGSGTSCSVCEVGFYKPQKGNGPCERCPEYSTTTSTRSTSRTDCHCIRGYEGNPQYERGSCQPIRCPNLNINNMEGVIMDPAECHNSFGSTCRFQCRANYIPIAGAEEITCLASRYWSATPLQCQEIICDPLIEPFNAVHTCSTPNRSIGTVCETICDAGYEFKPDSVTNVTCQRISEISAHWSSEGVENPCQEVSCPPLSTHNPMRVFQSICLKQPKFNQDCRFYCTNGYEAEGNVDTLTCTADGTWSLPPIDITCVDAVPPMLTCPEDIMNPTDPGMPTCTMSWEEPVASDNSGIPVKLQSSHSPPYRFDINTTLVVYTATDATGNMENCTFSVTIRDEEPPRLTNCPADSVIQNPNANDLGDLGIEFEDWNTSEFDDNSGAVAIEVFGAPPDSMFPLGETEIITRGTDSTGNIQECIVTVTVTSYTCQYYPPPLNGAIACDNWAGGQYCTVSCLENFQFTGPHEDIYSCTADVNGEHRWTRFGNNNLPVDMPWPNCAEPVQANGVSATTGFKFGWRCLNSQSQQEIRQNFINVLDTLLQAQGLGPCHQFNTLCSFENVVVQCGRTGSGVGARRRRQVISGTSGFDEVEVTFTLLLEIRNAMGPDFNIIDYMERAVNSVEDNIANGNETVNVDNLELALSDYLSFVYPDYTILCDSGYVPSNGSCVPCAPGTFENNGVCHRCPIGTYQDQYGDTSCIQCPNNASTVTPGARSVGKCRDLCRPGTFSSTGLDSCNACPVGTYEPGLGSTSCLTCPEGLTTWTTGSTHQDRCTDICPRGSSSPTGYLPCTLCPKGTYQPHSRQQSCIPCLDSLYTHREGAHAIQYCQVINECEWNPCANGATCMDIPRGYECVCSPGFTGNDCEIDIDECYGNDVCLNNATCIDMVNDYECECIDGFEGENCQINIDDCLRANCRYGSTCVDGIASYTCDCAEGFIGEYCEINLYDCASDPCKNGASCIDLNSNFSCCCAPGYTGRLCELVSDHCQSSPCHGNASCISTRNSYTCTCPPGFEGHNCDININECLQPTAFCLNGGTCEDLVNGYQCNCPLGFNGDHCQIALPTDFDLTYPTARTADRVELEGVLPDLYEFTLAFWMKTSDTENYGTPISYATRVSEGFGDQDNILNLQDYNNFVLYVNRESAFTYTGANGDNNWHFISVTWTSETGDWVFYINGTEVASGSGLSRGNFVQGRGMFVVGQDQDTYNGAYVVKESFVGTISQVNIWDYAMRQNEIQSLQSSCSLSGNALSWGQLSTGLRGDLQASIRSEICNNVASCRNRQCSQGPGLCPLDTICLNGGTCVTGSAYSQCQCPRGYSGEICESRDDCRDIDCERGSCAVHQGKSVCQCPDGFAGRRCQFDIDECSENNGGCDHQCDNTPGSFICSCRLGYALQPDGKTCNSVTFCKRNGIYHSAQDPWEEGCNACGCQDGRAVCTPKPCPRLRCRKEETEVTLPGACCPVCLPEMKTCSVDNYGDYKTFDKYTFSQRGDCRYLLTRDYTGTGNFEVHMEHQFHNITGRLSYAIAVFIYIDCVEVKIDFNGLVYVQDEVVGLPYEHRNPANVRIAHVGDGSEVEVFSNKGLVVTWSPTTGVRVNLTKNHASNVQGLCGNMDGSKKDDKLSRQGIMTSKGRQLLHSWKVEDYKYCRRKNATLMEFGYLQVRSCSSRSYRDFGLAFQKCRVFFKNAFRGCVRQVDPTPYMTNCIEDTCTCGVMESCHCEAISAYVQECRRQLDLEVKNWKRHSACELYCPPTMIYDECGPSCEHTCEDPTGRNCDRKPCTRGCHCRAGEVVHNGGCIEMSECPAMP